MKHTFPPEGQNFTYLQTNRSDRYGSLWSTFNIDLQSNKGSLRLSHKLIINTNSDDDSDLGLPTAFEYFDDRWWAVCGTRVFKNSSEAIVLPFSEDASTGAQTNYVAESDLAVFNSRLWSTTNTTLYSKASGSGTGTWTSRDTLGSGTAHKLAYLKKFDRLYYLDTATKVSSIDNADVVSNSAGDYFLDLGNNVGAELTTMVENSDFLWLGTMAITNSASGNQRKGRIIQWDGISSQITKDFKLDSAGVLAMCVIDDIPYAIDCDGRVLKYTGSSFKEVARFPLSNSQLKNATTSAGNARFIHFNGMQGTKDNTILLLISNTNEDSASDINENLPSGIWELDLATGNFIHRNSATLQSTASSTITDFGQNIISDAGALKVNTLGSNSSSGRSKILAGINYYTNASTVKSGIFIESPDKRTTGSGDVEGQKRGYAVTSWIESSDINENWSRIWAIYRRFLNSTDKIILKYRFIKEDPLYISITWVDTTHFTTATDVTAYGPTATGFDSEFGGEAEILQGVGSGACPQITSVSGPSGGLYTVTLDNAVTGATTTTAKARLQKWKKLKPEITGQEMQYSEMSLGEVDVRMQIKMVFEWTGDDEFIKMIINSTGQVTYDS